MLDRVVIINDDAEESGGAAAVALASVLFCVSGEYPLPCYRVMAVAQRSCSLEPKRSRSAASI